MKKYTKEQILSSLNEEFIVTKAEKRLGGSELEIDCEFTYNGRIGRFIYTLIGRDIGIDKVDFEEKDREDIYEEIHDWIEAHITTETKLFRDNKEI